MNYFVQRRSAQILFDFGVYFYNHFARCSSVARDICNGSEKLHRLFRFEAETREERNKRRTLIRIVNYHRVAFSDETITARKVVFNYAALFPFDRCCR